MRYQLMAMYRGLAFEAALGPTDEDVVLFAAGSPPEGLQFEPAAGQWRRQVSRSELDALWESRPVGRYRGHGCLVLDDLGDRLHIAFQGHDAYQAEQLGYWQVDRGVYEVVVPRHDVTDLTGLRDDHQPRRAEPALPAGTATTPPGPAATAPGPGTTPPGLMTIPPGLVPAEMFGPMTSQPGAIPATAPVTPPGPMPAETRATSPPGPVPAEAPATSRPGPSPAETAGPGTSGPLPAPPGPLPAGTVASASTQPQRPVNPQQGGAEGPAAPEPAVREPAGQEPAGQEPAAPEPEGSPQGSTGPQRPWSQRAQTASPAAWTPSPGTRTGNQPAPGSRQQPPVPDAAGASGEGTARAPAAPSPRVGSPLPADMMAPAPPREPPANGTGRWRPWVPEPDQAGTWEPGPAASSTNGANGWNGSNGTGSAASAGRTGGASHSAAPGAASSPGRGNTARDHADTHSIFRELVGLAAVPDGSYAVDEDVDGALCLVRTDDGFEVYSSAGSAKHEVRFFEDEESAYFYLFGVLAADALRSGRLVRRQD